MTHTTAVLAEVDSALSAEQFQRIAGLLHEHAGIRMRPGKEGLVRARLTRRLRECGMADFAEYLRYVGRPDGSQEFDEMIEALTTNKTSFLRERAHFDYLQHTVVPELRGPARCWSAGCSTGEEAYTLAMVLGDARAPRVQHDTRILATDINTRTLRTARAGTYSAEAIEELPDAWQRQYWMRHPEPDRVTYTAQAAIRSVVQFAQLNLMESWPMRGPFDVIMCRNVMIYFDKVTQQRLIERFWALLRPGGHLFVGHSESLTNLSHRFRYVQPAVYIR